LSVITRRRLLARLLLLSKNADSRRRKKRKLLVLERCKKRQPTDSQRSTPSVQSVPSKRASVKHVRRRSLSVKSNRGRQTSLRLLANASSLNGKQQWPTKPRLSATTSYALSSVKKKKKRRSANWKRKREML
jgi:hypothetical protein